MNIRRSIAVGVLLGLMQCLHAQEIVGPLAPMNMDLDYARFFGSELQLYTEFYYGVREDQLTYRRTDSVYTGGFLLRFDLWTDSGKQMSRELTVRHTLRDGVLRNQTLIGVQPFGLLPGRYSFRVVATDVNDPTRRDSVAIPVPVALIPQGRMSISDIELCTEIRDSAVNTASPFYKNTKEVQPNPSMLYGLGLPILYYYAEVYNLKSDLRGDELLITSSVIDAAGHEVLKKSKKKPRQFDSSVELGTMNLSQLPGGTYVLRLTLSDSARTPFAQSSRKFFVYNPRMTSSDSISARAVTAMGEFEFMTEDELDREFRFTRYIATGPEREQFDELQGVDAKRAFLHRFWKDRDLDRVTERNEYRDEYLRRVQLSQQEYTVGVHQGWLSDRGRVRIVYGEPDEIERNPSNQETFPYEIWQFDKLQGGVIFVFVDMMGMNDYQLVHSTHRNELHNENWEAEFARKPFNH